MAPTSSLRTFGGLDDTPIESLSHGLRPVDAASTARPQHTAMSRRSICKWTQPKHSASTQLFLWFEATRSENLPRARVASSWSRYGAASPLDAAQQTWRT